MELGKYIIYNDEKILANLHESGYERDPNHKFLIFAKNPPKGFISQGATILTKFYLGSLQKSVKNWKKDKTLYEARWIHSKTKVQMVSKKISYLIFAQVLRDKACFDFNEYNLSPMECFWLDHSLDISINFHKHDDNATSAITINAAVPQQQYGEEYPIKPQLDREGHIFTSFQTQLLKKIINTRTLLVENSHQALSPDWVFDLRTLINDSISLIDITLNQLYNKAEYSPEPDWHFDVEKLGQKNNRRLVDKLKWVRTISGNTLNIEQELVRLNSLRELRNHLNHFDPPTFVLTLEEAANWLNDILYLGQVLIKIREALGVNCSNLLVDFISQKEVIFQPEEAFSKRLPLDSKINGYGSCLWPSEKK